MTGLHKISLQKFRTESRKENSVTAQRRIGERYIMYAILETYLFQNIDLINKVKGPAFHPHIRQSTHGSHACHVNRYCLYTPPLPALI